KMKLDKASHAEITKELGHLKKGGRKEDATPEIRKLVKQLTGYEYDQCFGNNNVGFKFENKAGAF
nr:MFS transporter [Escherichia coli]